MQASPGCRTRFPDLGRPLLLVICGLACPEPGQVLPQEAVSDAPGVRLAATEDAPALVSKAAASKQLAWQLPVLQTNPRLARP